MPFQVQLNLQCTAEKLPYPALPFHIAQHNPWLAHLCTEVGEKEKRKLDSERHKLMNARLDKVAEHIRTLGYSAQFFLPTHVWDKPDPRIWTIAGGTLSPGSGNLPIVMFSPERPFDSDWAQEFATVVDSVTAEYGCEVTINRMLQFCIVDEFELDDVKRVFKLFCLFEGEHASYRSQWF